MRTIDPELPSDDQARLILAMSLNGGHMSGALRSNEDLDAMVALGWLTKRRDIGMQPVYEATVQGLHMAAQWQRTERARPRPTPGGKE